jgi:glycosyltransferase involved in cell wall biosynthesis
MRIGVFLESTLSYGGGFQQALSVILALQRAAGQHHEICVFTTRKPNLTILQNYGVCTEYFKFPSFSKLLAELSLDLMIAKKTFDNINNMFGIRFGRYLDNFLEERKIDIVYFVEPSELALKLKDYHYLFTVWDLCHRDRMEFPEVYKGSEFERRENLYRRALPKAIRVISDSAIGKDRICKLYGVDFERVIVMPFLPSVQVRNHFSNLDKFVDIKKKYGIEGDYVFYPAQFWPHKNHVYILEGLRLLRDEHDVTIHAVFCGKDAGNKDFVRRRVDDLGLKGQVHFLGFVGESEIPHLYSNALSLVMPSYFGPTNIPPFEAFALSCPVIYSDLPSFRQQTGGGALYCDLTEPRSLVGHILTLRSEPETAAQLVAKGHRILEKMVDDHYVDPLEKALTDYSYIKQRWASSI